MAARWGIEKIATGAIVEWDVSQPKDMQASATATLQAATALSALNIALQPFDRQVDIAEFSTRFAIPLLDAPLGGAVEPASVNAAEQPAAQETPDAET